MPEPNDDKTPSIYSEKGTMTSRADSEQNAEQCQLLAPSDLPTKSGRIIRPIQSFMVVTGP